MKNLLSISMFGLAFGAIAYGMSISEKEGERQLKAQGLPLDYPYEKRIEKIGSEVFVRKKAKFMSCYEATAGGYFVTAEVDKKVDTFEVPSRTGDAFMPHAPERFSEYNAELNPLRYYYANYKKSISLSESSFSQKYSVLNKYQTYPQPKIQPGDEMDVLIYDPSKAKFPQQEQKWILDASRVALKP